MISDVREFEKYHRQSWEGYAKAPYFWFIKAEVLYDAANAVRNTFWLKKRKPYDLSAASNDFYKGPIYMLLAGLAVETLIKGIIVGLEPKLVQDNYDMDFKGKAITVRSTDPNDPSIVAATIIDCEGTEAGNHRGFNFVSGEG